MINPQPELQVFSRVALLGTGLIGGSIGLGLMESRRAGTVVAFDLDAGVASRAVERGAASIATKDLREAAEGADLVVVSAPVDACAGLCGKLAEVVSETAVVTDVGSAKGQVVAECERLLGARFIGGHPMAGSERHGIEAASPDLFQDASWILTPTARTASAAYRSASALAVALGARPVALEPEDHDRLLARLSHLPQLLASALVNAAVATEEKQSLLGLAAGGFRDVTRIAASDPALWVTILRANREAVLDALREYDGSLQRLASLLEEERWGEMRRFLSDGRRARLDLFGKPEMHEVPVALSMPVLDRPGVLAEVTTAAGSLGANIEDLRIVHSTEGGRGRLELIVAGEGPAARLAETLAALGYRVERGRPE